MRSVASICAMALLFAPSAFADYFQIYNGSTPYYIQHARVVVGGRDVGGTDAMGRIKIDLPPGNYAGEIIDGTTKKQVTLTIDGGGQLKTIHAN